MCAEEFATFVGRIRAGDAEAAAELVRRYEPAVRLEVRLRLQSRRLRRLVDSLDICQSVLASFLVRMAAGQYDLRGPGQLVKLLAAIARNKVAYHARREQAECRDYRRIEGGDVRGRQLPAADPSPSRLLAGRELLAEVRRHLTSDEWRLAELRGQGHSWAEIAAELGGQPEARRMQLARALDRVTRQLGLEDRRP
jgi:RNA polymerase sigma-70 factor (ECF subfamily)